MNNQDNKNAGNQPDKSATNQQNTGNNPKMSGKSANIGGGTNQYKTSGGENDLTKNQNLHNAANATGNADVNSMTGQSQPVNQEMKQPGKTTSQSNVVSGEGFTMRDGDQESLDKDKNKNKNQDKGPEKENWHL